MFGVVDLLFFLYCVYVSFIKNTRCLVHVFMRFFRLVKLTLIVVLLC